MELNNKISGVSLKPQGWGSSGDDTRIVLGLKFSMCGFSWVGELRQVLNGRA